MRIPARNENRLLINMRMVFAVRRIVFSFAEMISHFAEIILNSQNCETAPRCGRPRFARWWLWG